jgi:hypothetical protein
MVKSMGFGIEDRSILENMPSVNYEGLVLQRLYNLPEGKTTPPCISSQL